MRKKKTYRTVFFVFITAFFFLCLILIFSKGRRYTEESESGFDKPEGYAEFYKTITTSIRQDNNGYKTGYQLNEYKKLRNRSGTLKYTSRDMTWEHRGPGNVGGRTREVLIDPDDPSHDTWYAAAASGGVWKTTSGGSSWINLTEDLINLATNALVMAPSDHNVLYIGTGEGYGGYGMVSGNGIFRSDDRGLTWQQLESTSGEENFRWVNKMVVSEENEDVLIVATNRGIFKTTDAGNTWDTVFNKGYIVQDLVVNPLNPSTMYAAINSYGILKSYDHGSVWFEASEGIGTGYRFSVDVSPADSNYVFSSAEAPNLKTDVYISKDGAGSWRKLKDSDLTFVHFLGEQGWFNNVIKADPFDKNRVFIGGVYFGSITFKNGTGISDPQVLRVDTMGTGSFMEFINFGGDYLRGGLTTGIAEDADTEEEDFISVELRFGPGIWQYAHRFTVPEGEGPGVPRSAYSYRDYVVVPFQAWDTDNNRQLMVSFRDQSDNGKFDLIERVWDDDINGREYVFVHAIEYAGIPDPSVALQGGHYNKMLYFLWPSLKEDRIWQPESLPDAVIRIKYGTQQLQNASTTILADDTRNSQLHVDHHAIAFAITDEANQEYLMVEGNDGGLGVSYDKGLNWEQIKNGYYTTQFYGVAKKPFAHEYIGGMQDNGTWQSPAGTPAGPLSVYTDRVAGDGFEALWHPLYPHRILASSYYNLIKVSNNGGKTWEAATEGMSGEGPFITRLSNSDQNPDLVFAVGSRGVYRHTNFCQGRYPWELVEIDTGWSVLNQVTSSHNVEVSLSDPSVVWAGAGLFENPDLFIFLSKNYGKTFKKVSLFPEREMGYITGIATHPRDTSTAYLLFSMDHKPKILRTVDFGESWQDITGFGSDSTSAIFPDVMVFSLLVFPDEPNRIWAGTEIGIIESDDNGVSWHLADNDLPSVSVWQMFIQDQTIVVATHGRGIWTAQYYPEALDPNLEKPEIDFLVYPNPTNGLLNLEFENSSFSEIGIEVFSSSGQLIFSGHDQKNRTIFKKQIDLSGYPGGIYIINIKADGYSYNKRILLQ
jgi:hypothetical protein